MNEKNILEKQKQINQKILLILPTISIAEIKLNNFVKNTMKNGKRRSRKALKPLPKILCFSHLMVQKTYNNRRNRSWLTVEEKKLGSLRVKKGLFFQFVHKHPEKRGTMDL